MNEIQNIVQTIQPAETAGNDPVLDVVGPEKTYQRLAEQIVSLISAGEFKVGERLPSERNLADRFQVSRTSVREAVISLEVQEVVEVRGGSGIYVCRTLDVAKPAYVPEGPGPFDLLRARRLIEGEIASQAAEVRKDSDVDRIYSTLTAMRNSFDNKQATDVADHNFHTCIAEATGNTVLVSVVNALWEQLRGPIWQRLEDHFHTPVLRQSSLQDHHQIFSAIAMRDSAAARSAMHAHIDRVISEFVKAWA